MRIVLLLSAALGHGLIWAGLVNRLHGLGLPRRRVKWITLGFFFAMLGIPLAMLAVPSARAALWSPLAALDGKPTDPIAWAVLLYLVVCWATVLVSMPLWIYRNLLRRDPHVVRAAHGTVVSLADAIAEHDDPPRHFLIAAPGNQSLHLDVNHRALDLPRWPATLDGLTLAHLSDFHFTGHVPRAYFAEVVRHCNELAPDLVALTGDFVDSGVCLDWAGDLLGEIRAPCGVYYVLGNHDRQIDHGRLRAALDARGLIDLGGRWLEISVRGEPIVLAGNELPWFAPAADLTAAPPPYPAGPPRILLSHSPDQIAWARRNEIDLMLAGHTHGGQIRLPWIGALMTPSLAGVRYASGVFYQPPTVMHVTRGVSGELPIRLRCPPEMTCLVLHSPPKAIQ